MAKSEPPTFLEALAQDDEQGRKCDLSLALGNMAPTMASEVKNAMASTTSAAAISRTLQRFNYPISEGAVRRCRRVCSCWKDTP